MLYFWYLPQDSPTPRVYDNYNDTYYILQDRPSNIRPCSKFNALSLLLFTNDIELMLQGYYRLAAKLALIKNSVQVIQSMEKSALTDVSSDQLLPGQLGICESIILDLQLCINLTKVMTSHVKNTFGIKRCGQVKQNHTWK